MNSKFIAVLFLGVLPTLAYAQYKSDWTYKIFYEELNACRAAVVFPNAKDYEKKGLSKGQTAEQLRSELIAITPVFESIASATCYCALNEIAKNVSHASFTSDQNKISNYLQGEKCKETTAQIIRSTMNSEKVKELRLK